MPAQLKLYEDFEGYNAYPLQDAEKMIRTKIGKQVRIMRDEVDKCLSNAKEHGKEKLISEILTLEKRIDRMITQIEERDRIYVPAYLRERITQLDEEKLEEIDSRVENILNTCEATIQQLSCAETDMHIIDRFTEINKNLRQMENLCHERSKLLVKDSAQG